MTTFSCRTNSTLLNQLLSCLGPELRKDQLCYIDASSTGLNLIMAGGSRSIQGQLSLPKNLFEQYEIDTETEDDVIRVLVDLALLIECSKIASNSELSMTTLSYSNENAQISLSIEEGSIMTVCEMQCVENDEGDEEGSRSMLESFRSSPEKCQIIIKSDILADSIEDILIAIGMSTVTLALSSSHLKISCHGSVGSSEIGLSKNLDGIVLFRCTESLEHTYLLSSFIRGIKALSSSYEVCLRQNAEDILYIQHQILTADGGEAYLNFLMLPWEED